MSTVRTTALRERIMIVVSVVGVIWLVEAVNWLLGHRLNALGLVPRDPRGLVGIATAPFLHVSLAHAVANTVPLLVLGWLVSVRGKARFATVSAGVCLLGGLAVWLFARDAIHVGASGLVFGLFGYIVARGWFERSAPALATAALAVLLYGGLVFGLLPARAVSFESHLFGLLAGALIARLEGRRARR